MRKINKLASKLLGREVVMDDSIPLGYLIRHFSSKFMCLLYGMVRMHCIKPVFIHPSTIIKGRSMIRFGKNLNIERGSFIDALSREGLIIGDNVSMGYNTYVRITGSFKQVGRGVIIGNNVGLGSNCFYGCGVGHLEIGDDTIFGNYVSVHPENHIYSDLSTPIRLQGVSSTGGVKIGKGCWIGAKATILDGTFIGDGCIVAAGAVVKGIFPDNTIIGGVPAKIIKQR